MGVVGVVVVAVVATITRCHDTRQTVVAGQPPIISSGTEEHPGTDPQGLRNYSEGEASASSRLFEGVDLTRESGQGVLNNHGSRRVGSRVFQILRVGPGRVTRFSNIAGRARSGQKCFHYRSFRR